MERKTLYWAVGIFVLVAIAFAVYYSYRSPVQFGPVKCKVIFNSDELGLYTVKSQDDFKLACGKSSSTCAIDPYGKTACGNVVVKAQKRSGQFLDLNPCTCDDPHLEGRPRE